MDSIRKVINENLLESSRLVEVGSGHLWNWTNDEMNLKQ